MTKINFNKNNQFCNLSEEERFWQKVDTRDDDECWEWKAYRRKFGHGQMFFRGKYCVASRISWILNRGEIPLGMNVLHKCDNPSCVNPNHLYIGTQKDNARDMTDRGRRFVPECEGEKNAMAKLNVEQVKEIRRIYAAGKFTLVELSEKYNVSFQQIHKIIKNKAWRHVS